jgi:hypothetical protein
MTAAGDRPGRLLLWAVGVILLANLAVFGLRLTNGFSKGAFTETTGAERIPIYGVWKAAHGHPVYELPFRPDFPAALYNFSFYYTYGFVVKVLGVDGESLVLAARLVTTAFAVLAALAFAWNVRMLSRNRDPGQWSRGPARTLMAYSVMAGVLTMFASAGVGWFPFTVRADMASMLFALTGLGLCVGAVHERAPRAFLTASFLFAIGWSFKQSTIGLLGGVCLFLLLSRRWRDLCALTVPFIAVAGATLLLGGEMYRANALTIPSLSRFRSLFALHQPILLAFVANAYLWSAPTAALAGGRWQNISGDKAMRMLLLVTAVSSAWCLMALSRDGGDRNSLLEAYLAASLLAFVLGWRTVRHQIGAHRWAGVLLGAVVVLSVAFPSAQLIVLDRLGDVTLGPAERAREARAIAAWMQAQPHPIFVEDSMLGLPWYSTQGQYPAVVMDNYLYFAVRASGGIVPGAEIERLVRDRRFPTLLLTGIHRLDETATEVGYRPVSLPLTPRHWRFRAYRLP